ncbi:GTP cyclohydrolase II [Syncephalis fuscata]|nr:GTP cyclohydrolase II [Syncephalis fuscata]
MQKEGTINFYNRGEPYYEFTNFYSSDIKIDDKHWPTTEHYFQAQKFKINSPVFNRIQNAPFARAAFSIARSYDYLKRWDWEEKKENIMLTALRAKFQQNPILLRKLLATGNRRLVEHTYNDKYWGDGGNGSGRNRLGELLMFVRKELQQHQFH